VGLHVLDRDPAAARSALEAIRDTSKEALASLRSELSVLSGEPAARTPRRDLDDLPALLARIEAAGVRVVSAQRAGDHAGDLSDGLSSVAVERRSDGLHVEVVDDGRGAERDVERDAEREADEAAAGHAEGRAAGHAEGMGIRGMRQRAEALGGRLVAGPEPSGGFGVHAVLPLGGVR
jgi:hypothetical protein